MRSKRGQFYLIAAAMIILFILGFAGITNNARKQSADKTELYELFVGTNINKQQIINYDGVYGGYRKEDIETLLSKLTEVYSGIDIIYFVIKKDVEKKYYEYNSEGNMVKLPSDPFIGYTFSLSANSYIMVIKESNGEQFVVQG